MSPSSDALAMFPSNDSMIRHPLPSPGSRRVQFSWFPGTMECSDALSPFSPRFVAFAWRYPPVRLSSSLPYSPTPAGGLELSGLAAPRQSFRTGDHRVSQVPGEPRCAYALFLGPGRTAASGHTTTAAWPPFMATTRAPTIRKISGLDSRAWARAVYASPLGSPQDDARLASGCLASFPGGIGYPQGSYEGFPVCFLHSFLLPKLS